MVTSSYNNGLQWFNNHIFVVSGSKIKQLDASTGSTVYEWSVPNSDFNSCIVIPRHGKYIAYSTGRSITFWDMSTHLQIGLVKHTEDICSIVLSPNNRSLAIGGCYGTIITGGVPHFIESDLHTDDAAFDAWKNNQLEAYMYLLLGKLHSEHKEYEHAIRLFEHARARMLGWKIDNLHITVRQCLCKILYAAGRRKDAAESLLEMVNSFDEEVHTSKLITKWVSDITHQCLSAPKSNGDVASTPTEDANMVMVHATPTPLLREWAKVKLAHYSWKDALLSAVDFVVSRFTLYRAIYECLETIGCTMDAGKCFRQMVDKLVKDAPDEQSEWVFDYRRRCMEKLESNRDTAASNEQHGGVVSHYPTSPVLKPGVVQNLLIKRSKAYVAKGLWVEVLNDVSKVIELNRLSLWGYERKHAALHKAGDYQNAINAFEAMLSRMLELSDPEIRALHFQYIDPGETRKTIQKAVQDVIHNSPPVLINILSGRLCYKSQQAASFESQAVFNELVSSMMTCIDDVRIKHEVTEYYCYGMFSHEWEDNEPLFEHVIHMVIVQNAGLQWAWSDTCCINKADHLVLEEVLVAMSKWYHGSTLTVVFLFDVLSPSQRGDLMRSIWNGRAWTFQAYHASKVVQFYTKD
ncbi:hypothetical protein V8E55_006530 [Tylopilus felleus]